MSDFVISEAHLNWFERALRRSEKIEEPLVLLLDLDETLFYAREDNMCPKKFISPITARLAKKSRNCFYDPEILAFILTLQRNRVRLGVVTNGAYTPEEISDFFKRLGIKVAPEMVSNRNDTKMNKPQHVDEKYGYLGNNALLIDDQETNATQKVLFYHLPEDQPFYIPHRSWQKTGKLTHKCLMNIAKFFQLKEEDLLNKVRASLPDISEGDFSQEKVLEFLYLMVAPDNFVSNFHRDTLLQIINNPQELVVFWQFYQENSHDKFTYFVNCKLEKLKYDLPVRTQSIANQSSIGLFSSNSGSKNEEGALTSRLTRP